MAYTRGQTIRCKTYVRDADNNLINPDDVTLEIYDADGILSESIPQSGLANDSTGIFYYDFDIPDDAALGDWYYQFEVVTSTVNVKYQYFTVTIPTTKLYCSIRDVYRKSGLNTDEISEEDVAAEIYDAQVEVEQLMQKKFTPDNEVTEWFDTEAHWDTDVDDLFLTYRPVTEITSIESYDKNGNVERTWDESTYYLMPEEGIIQLRHADFEHQRRRVKVVYKYGYSDIPPQIKDLVGVVASIRSIVHQMGGTYDDVTSYSMPSGVSVSLGEPYTSMRATVDYLDKRKKSLIETIGRYNQQVFIV